MSKKIVLFSTRDLEQSGPFLFNTNDAKKDLALSDSFCGYFVNTNIGLHEELVSYFRSKKWQLAKDDLQAISRWKKSFEKDSFQTQYENVLKEYGDNENVISIIETFNTECDTLLSESESPHNLVKLINNDYENQKDILNWNLDCSRKGDKLAPLYIRFLCYFLNSCNDNYAVYAVWPLSQKCKDDKWYNALLQEIMVRNRNVEDDEIEIILMLHDKDIAINGENEVGGRKVIFDVIKYRDRVEMEISAFGKTEKKMIILTISLFQHPRTRIGALLKTPGLSSEEVYNLVSEQVKLPLLKNLSNILSKISFNKKEFELELNKLPEEERVRQLLLNEAGLISKPKREISDIINTRMVEIESMIKI